MSQVRILPGAPPNSRKGQAPAGTNDLLNLEQSAEDLPVDPTVAKPSEIQVVDDDAVSHGEEVRPLPRAPLRGRHPTIQVSHANRRERLLHDRIQLPHLEQRLWRGHLEPEIGRDQLLTQQHGELEAAARRADATICLTSSLAHYDLTDTIPDILGVAILRGSRTPATRSAITWHLFVKSTFIVGRDELMIPGATQPIGIYSAERSIVDAFRLRGELGYELGRGALREWLRRGGEQ